MKHLNWFEIEVYYPIDASLFEAEIELSEVEKNELQSQIDNLKELLAEPTKSEYKNKELQEQINLKGNLDKKSEDENKKLKDLADKELERIKSEKKEKKKK